MSKSLPQKNVPEVRDAQPTADTAAGEAEQQVRHRTAVRIAGIEGIDSFADIAENTEPHPAP